MTSRLLHELVEKVLGAVAGERVGAEGSYGFAASFRGACRVPRRAMPRWRGCLGQ